MNTMLSAMDLFNLKYDATEHSVAYNPLWENGTGYFDAAVEDESTAVVFPEGVNRVKSIDPHGRKMLFQKTAVGAIVVFQRFKEGKQGVLVNNQHPQLNQTGIVPEGAMGYNTVRTVLGDQYDYPDLTEVIDNLIAVIK